MFDQVKGIFEKFSFTDEDANNEKRKPIISNHSVSYCFKVLKDYVNKNNYKKIAIKEEFNEIYYIDKDQDEITLVLLTNNNSKTIISCHVLSKKRGKSRKKLYNTLKTIESLLNK